MGDGVHIGCKVAYPAIPPLANRKSQGAVGSCRSPFEGLVSFEKEKVILLKTLTTVPASPCPSRSDGASSAAGTPPTASVGRVCIATGTHGDEIMGQLIVYLVQQRIADHPDALCGTVDFYPMLNPLGLDIGERMVPSGTPAGYEPRFPRLAERHAA